MNTILKWSGVVALVILAILGLGNLKGISLGSATACTDTYTCFTNLETQGNSIVDGTSTFVGAITAAAVNATSATLSGLLTLDGGVLYSKTNATTTSATAQTLSVSDVQAYSTVILTPNVGTDTVTLFASSTATTWLPTAGDMQRTCFVNGTTTAGVYLIFAGGTGTTFLVASSSATALGSTKIGPQKMGCFDFVRGNATATTFDIIGAFSSFQ